jgi:hypothetical protein
VAVIIPSLACAEAGLCAADFYAMMTGWHSDEEARRLAVGEVVRRVTWGDWRDLPEWRKETVVAVAQRVVAGLSPAETGAGEGKIDG